MKLKFINQLFNIIWTSLAFLPLAMFWIKNWEGSILFGILILSLLLTILPLDYIRLTKNKNLYEKAGVKKFMSFTQDGKLAKRLSKTLSDPASLKLKGYKLISITKSYERFHVLCFYCFLLSTIVAGYKERWLYVLLMFISNILFNVYPILLQQYLRLRISAILLISSERR